MMDDIILRKQRGESHLRHKQATSDRPRLGHCNHRRGVPK